MGGKDQKPHRNLVAWQKGRWKIPHVIRFLAILVFCVVVYFFPQIIVFILLLLIAYAAYQRSEERRLQQIEAERQKEEQAEKARIANVRRLKYEQERKQRLEEANRIRKKEEKERFQKAKAEGIDVCEKCETIRPRRCARIQCKECIEVKCGGSYYDSTKYCKRCQWILKREAYDRAKAQGIDVCDDCLTIHPSRCTEGNCGKCLHCNQVGVGGCYECTWHILD